MTTVRTLAIAALSSCMFLISSCGEDEETPCSLASFPFLVVGNQLIYYYAPSLIGGEDTVTLDIQSELSDGNFKLAFTAVNSPLLNVTAYYFPCNDKIYAGNNPVSTSNDHFLSTNANVGDTWTRAATTGGTIVEHSLLSKTETLVLPAGTFTNCWKVTYHQQGTFNTDTIFWRHDIGYVKYTGLLDYYLISKNF